ncbi:MAG: Rieske 2Fe-2S domain-containing protein [Deltaproteobacteria bacterium]|nr:Rieske 2Fe-2S domain-containing protein [Deltaproteobacteria bacterium]
MTTRRVVLQTIGMTGAAGCLGGCGGGGGSGVPRGTATMCGANLCLDLAENTELQLDNGILFFDQAPGKKLFVRRSGDTFVALSAVCTHANCLIDWNGEDQFDCDCHGSVFNNMGGVVRGPAAVALRSFATSVAGDMVTITL